MGFSITLDSRGLVQTATDTSTNTINFASAAQTKVPKATLAVPGAGVNATVGANTYVLLDPDTVAVTASLPAITSDIIGSTYTLMNSDATLDMFVSGANNVGGTTFTRVFASAYGSVTLMPVSSSNVGFYWHVVSVV